MTKSKIIVSRSKQVNMLFADPILSGSLHDRQECNYFVKILKIIYVMRFLTVEYIKMDT